ncbi:MAG: hypothetical protein ABGZ35_32330 [Planctomycetaceae bacterium]
MFNAARFCSLGFVICIVTGCGGGDAPDTVQPNEAGWNADTGKQAAANKKAAGPNGDENFGDEDFGDQVLSSPAKVKSAPAAKSLDVSPSAASSSSNGQISFLGIPIPAGLIPGLPGLTGAGSIQSPDQLPPLLTAWSDQHLEFALRIRSKRLPEAISVRAESSQPKPKFVALLKKLLIIATEPRLVVPDAAPSAVEIAAVKPAGAAAVRRGRFGTRGRDDDDDRKSRGPGKAQTTPPGIAAPEFLPNGNVYYDGDEMSFEEYEELTDEEDEGLTKSEPARPNPNSTTPAPVQDFLSDREVLQAIVQGLLVNDSVEAWATLQSVLQGQQQTPLDLKQASIVVFEEVFGQESINPAGAQELAVSVLNTTDPSSPAMDLLVSLASRVARVDLHMDDSLVDAHSSNPPDGKPPGGPATRRPPPQAVFFGEGGDEDFGGPTRFTRRGRGGKREDEEDDNRPAAQQPKPPPPTLTPLHLPPAAIEAVVPVLRSSTVTAAVLDRLADVADLTSGKSVIALASMLPNQRLRHATFQVLNEHNAEGADMFRSSGFYGHLARDPGHLLVLKSLPRLRNPPSTRNPTPPPEPSRVSWSAATWDMVRALRGQLSETASNADIAWDGDLQPRPYKGTVPEVATQLVINEGSDSTDQSTGVTHVYYTRSRVTPATEREMTAIAKYYETVARGFRREKPDEGILWFDGVRTTSNGLRTTIDVIISKSAGRGQNPREFRGNGNASAGPAAKPGDTFTVETIAVVAADPRDATTPRETADAD